MKQASPRTRLLAISGLMVAAYCAIMYLTQSFAFGPYQIRLATGLYAMSYLFPFLVVPLGAANALSNLLGGLGVLDIVGGALAGLVTGGAVWAVRRFGLPQWLIVPIIIGGPGLLVPLWLSPVLGLPYGALAISLCIGQVLPALLGWQLVRLLQKYPIFGENKE